jgi:anti-anti-sigma regulatory factor
VSGQPTGVSVDLTKLTYIDGVGIRLLFDPTSHLQKSKIALKLIDLLNHLPAELIQFPDSTRLLYSARQAADFLSVCPKLWALWKSSIDSW